MPLQLTGAAFITALVLSLVVAGAILALLHQAPPQLRRWVIVVLTFLGGGIYVLEFFVPPTPSTGEAVFLKVNLTDTVSIVGQATQIVAGFAFLLGVINLSRIHGNNVRRRRVGWPNSVAFFAAFLLMVVAGFWRDWKVWFGGPAPPVWIKDPDPAHVARPHDLYTLLFEGFYRNLEATMFSILAFYIVSAAYRAFRVRSVEAGILMVVALILMMGQVPLGMAATNGIDPHGSLAILRIENFSQYVLTAINSPVQRAMGFGIGLGMLAMALRIWLSLERGTYFQEEASVPSSAGSGSGEPFQPVEGGFDGGGGGEAGGGVGG